MGIMGEDGIMGTAGLLKKLIEDGEIGGGCFDLRFTIDYTCSPPLQGQLARVQVYDCVIEIIHFRLRRGFGGQVYRNDRLK
jgi:hypothetical protein